MKQQANFYTKYFRNDKYDKSCEINVFSYQDIEQDDIRIEVILSSLSILQVATTYNFKGEVVSRNKIIGWWEPKNEKKFFNILENNINISWMPEGVYEEYKLFVDRLKKKYLEVK